LLLGGALVFAGLRNFINRPTLTGIMAAGGAPQVGLVLHAGPCRADRCRPARGLRTLGAHAAAALIVFLVAATVVFDSFWDHEGIERHNRINSVIANVALTGGFLLLVAG
jgi:putative oxidoreductase